MSRNVIPIKVLAGPIVGKANLKAAALGHCFAFDYADGVCHWANLKGSLVVIAETKSG